jgi:potassium-transporting ATPase KdpC subunit
MMNILSEIRVAAVATVMLIIVLCGVYPLAVWGIAQVAFPYQANGSLIVRNGKTIGSERIAQNFSGPQYFRSRPSAAGDTGYDAASSGGSNLGPLSGKLVESVKERVETYRAENGLAKTVPVPADAVTASASGLDPDISVRNALLQAGRVARERRIGEESVKRMIRVCTQGRDLGIFGEERVNVLQLNLALDGIR